MKPTHRFQELAADKRPQDPHLDGRSSVRNAGSRRRMSRHDATSDQTHRCRRPLLHLRSITQNGKVVDSPGYVLDLEDK